MKRLIMLGAIAGFGISLGCGAFSEGTQWSWMLVRASVGALAGGLVVRWFLGVWLDCLHSAQMEKTAVRERMEEQQNNPKK
jgi:hypothetical protein